MILKDKFEIADKIINLTGKLAIIIGAAVLLTYCQLIGYFPTDVSIGDGLLLILVALGFGLTYLFFAISLTSLGIVLGPIWNKLQIIGIWIEQKYCHLKKRRSTYEPFKFMPDNVMYRIFGFFGVLFILFIYDKNSWSLPILLLTSFGSSLLWNTYLRNNELVEALNEKDSPTIEEKSKKLDIKKKQFYLPFFVILLPLFFSQAAGNIVTSSMKILNIRNDSATVHLKNPYSTLATENGITGNKSNFGEEYQQYTNSKILLSGFGKNIVISLNAKDGNTVQLSVPTDYIFVISK